jgi:hypothetical protein
MRLSRSIWVTWLAFCGGNQFPAYAQGGPTTTPIPAEVRGEDSDPTRPVVWSLREEFYNLRGSPWTNQFIFRSDRAFFRDRPRLGGKRGWLTRIDFPFAVAHRPNETQGGLGDIYAQILYVPYLKNAFAFAGGTGVFFPSATDRFLGAGKWTIAPVVAPVWFFPKKGLFFVKFQGYSSFAGQSNRPDQHYMTVTPLLVWRTGKKWWIQIDSESKTDFERSCRSYGKSSFLVGRMVKNRVGIWIKSEVYYGGFREADFAIKTSIFRVK